MDAKWTDLGISRSPAIELSHNPTDRVAAMPATRRARAAASAAADAGILDILQPGDECLYTAGDGTQSVVKVLKTHHDDAVPYYTIDLGARGRETIRSRLELIRRQSRPSRSPARQRSPPPPSPPRPPPPPARSTTPPQPPSRVRAVVLALLLLALLGYGYTHSRL